MNEIRNGRLAQSDGSAEPAGSRGVFETLLLREGAPVFFREHCERFAAGCARFGLIAAPGAGALRSAAAELVRATGVAAGVLRWAAWTDAAGAEGWSMRVEPPRPHMLAAAWRVAVSPLRLPPADADAIHKHLGRKRWRDALEAGRAAGCDEVLLADGTDGVVEGAISNVFIVCGGALITPAASAGPLPGIVRAKVLELSLAEGVTAREDRLALADLPGADEIFLTNSLAGVRPVAWLDGRILPAPGPVTLRLQSAWRRIYGWD